MSRTRAQAVALLTTNVTYKGDCWEWAGYTSKAGYAIVSFDGQTVYGHRFAHEAFKGPIPAGFCVCHSCDNPPCINPAHLFCGTKKDNTQDMLAKGRDRSIPHPGSTNGFAVLTEDQVLFMRVLQSVGLPLNKIALCFGVGRSTVAYAVEQGWRHVSQAEPVIARLREALATLEQSSLDPQSPIIPD